MRYHELVEILHEAYPIQVRVSGHSPSILDVQPLDGNHGNWNEHVLYVGSLARLKNPPDRPVMLLSVDEPVVALPEGSNFALIHSDNWHDLFKVTKDLILEDLRGQSIFYELTRMALNQQNIAQVINTAARLLGNALILVDLNQKVLAHSTSYEIVDPLWAQNVERGYCSYEFVQKVRSSRHMQEWSKQGDETRLITLPGDLQPKLVARITKEGHVAGALIMVEHHTPIARIHHRLLPLVGRLLFDTFFRDAAPGKVNSSTQSTILYNLLDDTGVSDTLEYMATSQVVFPAEMVVVVARFVHRMENRYLKRTFSMELKRIFPGGHTVHYKSYTGILVPSIDEHQREKLVKLARNENVSIGISWPFSDITKFKMYFYQAVASIKLAHNFGHTNQVYDYSDYFFYDLLDNYTGKIPLDRFCHPVLQVLRDYDRANNTELYVTLRAYLENNKNLRATAEALFIHRNTLIYRINRINQLIKLNLNSAGVVNALMDSFRIEHFLNK